MTRVSSPAPALIDVLRGALTWQRTAWPAMSGELEAASHPLDADEVEGPTFASPTAVRDVPAATGDGPRSWFTHFVDGTQTTVPLGRLLTSSGRPAAALYTVGGAATMSRDDRGRPVTVALERFDALLLPHDYPCPAGIAEDIVERVDCGADEPFGFAALQHVRRRRAALEVAQARRAAARPDAGRVLVDGDLAGFGTDLPATLVGVVKALNLRLASAELTRALMSLEPGQRTDCFTVDYQRGGTGTGAARCSWFLRLRPCGAGDPGVGVVRVEVPDISVNASAVDEVSRWLLAERGRPGGDVHNPILMVEIVEARLRAAMPERAWLPRLFPRH